MDNPITAGSRWLSLKWAAVYIGMGTQRLKRMAADPASCVVGFQDPDSGRNDWVFDRHSLDGYRQGQAAAGQAVRKEALDLMQGHGLCS